MKILSSADHHFDEHSRFEECVRVHDDMVRVVRDESVDLFLSAGDIYERASTPRERQAAADWLIATAEYCPVVIARGNHDKDRDLEILSRLQTRHPVTVVEKAAVVEAGGALVAAVAWPNPAALKQADMEPRDALRAVLRGLGSELSEYDGPRILLGHFMVDGATVSNGQPLLGQPINVALDDLALAKAHLGIMGHIHKAQAWDINGSPHCYVGSPIRTDFGQLEEKQILLAEFDGQKLVRLTGIPTAASPMVHLTGEWEEAEGTLYVDIDEEQVSGAEVRLRYKVPRDRRTAAWGMAQKYRAELLACGARSVKVEEVPVVVKRARAPEVARARSIVDKLPAHWKAIEFDPGDRAKKLLEKAHAIEETVGMGGAGPTSLRLHSFRCRDLGPHHGEFGFDLDQIPERSIVAFTGENGAGKTHSLEMSIGGACHRRTPSQNTPIRRANSRDSLLESTVSAGNRTWTIRHTMDNVSGKSEALVLDAQGEPAYPGTSVKQFDKWAARFLPDPSVLYSTQFSAQPSGKTRPRFIDLDSADRISVLLKAMGVERLEDMAMEARRRRDEALAEVQKATLRLDDEVKRVGDLKELRKADEAARKALAEATELVRATTASLEKSKQEIQKACLEEERRANLRLEREKVSRELEETQIRLREARHRVNNLEQVLEGSEDDEKLASELPALQRLLEQKEEHARHRLRLEELDRERQEVDREIENLDLRLAAHRVLLDSAEEIRKHHQDLLAAEKMQKELRERHSDLIDRVLRGESRDIPSEKEASLEAEKDRLRIILEEKQAVAEAVDRLTEVRGEFDEASEVLRLLKGTLEELQGAHVAGAEERITGLRSGLRHVVDDVANAKESAEEALSRDDETVSLATSIPQDVAATKAKIAAAEKRLDVARSEKMNAERVAEKRDTIVVAQNRLNAIESELLPLREERTKLREKTSELRKQRDATKVALQNQEKETDRLAELAHRFGELSTAEAVVEELTATRESASARRAKNQQDRDAVAKLTETSSGEFAGIEERITKSELASERQAERTTARARLEEVRPQLQALQNKESALAKRFSDYGDLGPVGMIDTTEQERALQALKQSEDKTRDEAAVAGVRLKTAQDSSDRIAVMRQEKEDAEGELADWERLALDFGRGGIQSAEVDAAGPELTDLCNEILRECHGTRFVMSTETKVLSADGKKDLDRCFVKVIDTLDDREDDASEFSGGERVFLGDVVEFALLMLSCFKADAQNPTIVRDESGAALDPKNSRAYFKMLRLVVDKVRASHLLIVTHNDEVKEMCDVQIHHSRDAGQTKAAE